MIPNCTFLIIYRNNVLCRDLACFRLKLSDFTLVLLQEGGVLGIVISRGVCSGCCDLCLNFFLLLQCFLKESLLKLVPRLRQRLYGICSSRNQPRCGHLGELLQPAHGRFALTEFLLEVGVLVKHVRVQLVVFHFNAA